MKGDSEGYTVEQVRGARQARAFLGVVEDIYRDDANYVRPLDMDINDVFNPKANPFFSHGECARWLLLRGGKAVGRIAAFVDNELAHSFAQPTGGAGFFECPDDVAGAALLFDTAKAWLASKGMAAMDGPINFGERDRWWGLLVDGFSRPVYGMNYSPPFYKRLFEEYGWKIYFNQYTYLRAVEEPLSELVYAKAARLDRDGKYTYRHLSLNKLGNFAGDFVQVYNAAWKDHENHKELPPAKALKLFGKLKLIADPVLCWFAYYEGTPVGFMIMLPDISALVQGLHGRSDAIGLARLFWRLKVKKHHIRKIYGMVFGITPRFQGRGIEAGLAVASGKAIQPLGRYDEVEFNWIGDFNPRMMHVAEYVGAAKYKTLVTYRYLFNRMAPFERAPIIGGDTRKGLPPAGS